MRGSPYRTVVAIGGIRSGKTLTLARWMIDRGNWDTSQFHGLFANTVPQRDSAILGEVLPWLEIAGIDWSWNKRPPAEWQERWRKLGIKVPNRQPRYTNVLILSSGLHIYCGTMSNRSYRQIKGMKFGSAVIEEVCAGATEEAIRFIFERVNCGKGPTVCAAEHHHVKILHANPPDDDGHWIYDWLAKREAQAAKKAGLQPSNENDSYPCLLRGVGDTIYIPSRTIDNVDNLPAEFIDDMAGSVDEETAKKVLDGVLTRTRKGRVYNAFSHENQIDVRYDPKRTLYVSLDFNRNPAVAIYAQPLNPGEYPAEHERAGVSHLGVFGEVFHIGGVDTAGMCAMLLDGEPGSDGSLPANFKGLLRHVDNGSRVVFFGDATSNFERMAGNDWQIVDQVIGEALRGMYVKNVPGKKNPLVPVGVHAVNAKFKSSRIGGEVRSLWIDPRCKHLIEDMLTNSWHKTDSNKIYKPGHRGGSNLWMTTHLGDALRYLVATLFPRGRDIDPKDSIPIVKMPKRERPPSFI